MWKFPYGNRPKQSSKKFASEPPKLLRSPSRSGSIRKLVAELSYWVFIHGFVPQREPRRLHRTTLMFTIRLGIANGGVFQEGGFQIVDLLSLLAKRSVIAREFLPEFDTSPAIATSVWRTAQLLGEPPSWNTPIRISRFTIYIHGRMVHESLQSHFTCSLQSRE